MSRSVVVLLQHGTKLREPTDPDLTAEGRAQAEMAAVVLSTPAPTRLVTSPRRRARATIQPLAAVTGLPVLVDDRVAERMEWADGVWEDFPAFLSEWGRGTADRTFVPRQGDSSRAAAERLRSAVLDHVATSAFSVISTHGGVTIDLLRDLHDESVSDGLLVNGMPNGCLTTLVVQAGEISVVGIGVPPSDWRAP